MMSRIERDTMGEVSVPEGAYYGAQTARWLRNFDIGTEKIPHELIVAFGVLKKAAAQINRELGLLSEEKARLGMGDNEIDKLLAAKISIPTGVTLTFGHY